MAVFHSTKCQRWDHNTKDGKYEEGICESMRFGSPYTPGAGAVPTYLAGRDELGSLTLLFLSL